MKFKLLTCLILFSSLEQELQAAPTSLSENISSTGCDDLFGQPGQQSYFFGVAPTLHSFFYGSLTVGAPASDSNTLTTHNLIEHLNPPLSTPQTDPIPPSVAFASGNLTMVDANDFSDKTVFLNPKSNYNGCWSLGLAQILGTAWDTPIVRLQQLTGESSNIWGSQLRHVFFGGIGGDDDDLALATLYLYPASMNSPAAPDKEETTKSLALFMNDEIAQAFCRKLEAEHPQRYSAATCIPDYKTAIQRLIQWLTANLERAL